MILERGKGLIEPSQEIFHGYVTNYRLLVHMFQQSTVFQMFLKKNLKKIEGK